MPQNIEKKLEVKLSVWYANGDFTESAKHMLHNPVIGHILTEAIKDRILYHLKHHYRLCYEGVLRLPEDLLIGHSYSRPEIINHFQAQYDPARHNTGVLKLMEGRYLVLFVNLKKAGDRERRRHDYEDKPLSSSQFQWESQNRDAEDSLMGQLYMNHEKMGVGIHLFAQPTQGEPYVYVGRLKYLYHAGNNPMRIIWQLQTQLNDDVFRQLYPDYAEQKTSDFDWSKL